VWRITKGRHRCWGGRKMKLIKWKGNPRVEIKHRHDYRWIKDKEEREIWVRKYWKVKEDTNCEEGVNND